MVSAFLAWLANVFTWLLGALVKAGAAPAVAEARAIGAGVQQASEAEQTAKTAEAEAQAVVDAPKDVAGTEAALDKGTF